MPKVAPKSGRTPLRAAQYLRKSTEHQRYSTENQAAAIAKYARRRGCRIVKTYTDEGISGLQLKNRKALKQLLADAVSDDPGYDLILVYDVSRWGRFQNPDQSAHYEFLCSEAGVPVEYCAESFVNDGSLSSTLLKNLKRVMAAEFSRELSTRVAAGKRRLARKGYWQNGRPGLGLRRQTVDEHGRPGLVLESGQRKGIQSHRTTLVPGPKDEIALVNRIFAMLVVSRISRAGIARRLNAEGLRTDRGLAWTFSNINSLVRNRKYVGDLVFNRMTNVLGRGSVRRPTGEWLLTKAVFEPIVDPKLFEAAQHLIRVRAVHMKKADMLPALAELLAARGRLSEAIINRSSTVPCTTVYRRHFGSLRAAYAAIGYACRRQGAVCKGLSDQEMLQRLCVLNDVEGRLSARILNDAIGVPSSSTYIRHFGSVMNAFALAGCAPMSATERASPVGQARAAAALAVRWAVLRETSAGETLAGHINASGVDAA